MPTLDQIVEANVTLQTTFPSRKGFGTPLYMVHHAFWAEAARSITSTSELDALNVPTSHQLYTGAVAVFSQSPRPPSLVVGKRTSYTQITELRPQIATEGYVYRFDVVDPAGLVSPIVYPVPAAATLTSVGTALAALIDPLVDMTAASVTAVITVTTAAGKRIGFRALPPLSAMKIKDVTTDPGIAADLATVLAAVKVARLSVFGVALDRASEAEINATASWIATQQMIYIPRSSDSEIADSGLTTDVASDLRTSARENVGGVFAQSATDDHRDLALLGRMLPTEPGAATWAYKELAGIAADTLTSAEADAVNTKRWTTYQEVNDRNFTFEGMTSDGNFIDLHRDRMFLQARIQEDLLGLLLSRPKIVFDQDGINVVLQTVQNRLETSTRLPNQILKTSPAPYVVPILDAAVDPSDKSTRRLTGIVASAVVGGAIHRMQVSITLTL